MDYEDGEPSERFYEFFRLFEILNLFYSTLRGGLNQYGGNQTIYFKSMIFLYAKEKLGAHWDKRAVKENFYAGNLKQQFNRYETDVLDANPKQSYLMRDLLGLASESKWWAEYKDTISTVHIPASSDEALIDRFKSPIHFKPIELKDGRFRIYFEGNQREVDKMLNKKFKISSSNRRRSFEIKTPEKFPINDFIAFAISQNILNQTEIKTGGRSNDLELLKDIYKQLKNNVSKN